MQSLREVATPLLDLSGALPFAGLQAAFDPFFPKGRLYYWKSSYVHDLSDACIDAPVYVAIHQVLQSVSRTPAPRTPAVSLTTATWRSRTLG